MKKIICLVLALMLLFCACRNENLPEREQPSQPENSAAEEKQEEPVDFVVLRYLCDYPGTKDTPADFEEGYPYKAEGLEVSKQVEEILYLMDRPGDFEIVKEIQNERILYAALKALPMFSVNDAKDPETKEKLEIIANEVGDDYFYPEEWVEKAAKEIFGEKAEVEHKSLLEENFIYHETAGVYTPPHAGLNSVIPYITGMTKTRYGCIAEFFYVTVNMSGFSLGDGGEWIALGEDENMLEHPEFIEFAASGKDIYTATFISTGGTYSIESLIKNPQEHEIIAEHIAALNEIKRETWFIESDDSKNYVPLYSEALDENFNDKTPDAVALSKDVYNDSFSDGKYNGYYVNGSLERCEEITNFRSEQEIADHIAQWVAPEFFDNENFRKHIMEYDGKLYRLWYSRGYGVSYYGDTVITEQTETEMTAVTKIYRIIKNEAGTAEIKFENRGGKWIIVSVEESYY
ncbi:MAG: hypothetical protein IJ306_03545 [Oscillospiraceae bacterium]|nr:hypothetical protein [Oscillospiraceae bacterium]